MSSPLRSARLARSLSQLQLAGLAGVSRQAIAAVEAGRSEPSLRLALALARVLGVGVEDLFATESALPAIRAEPLAPLGPQGSRVALAPLAGRLVAVPLHADAGVRSGFAPAGGLVGGLAGTVRPVGAVRPCVVVAGCDPALSLLETPLALLDPPVGLLWRSCASADALELAAQGLVHAAGTHVRDREGGGYNHRATERLGPSSRLLGFSSWRQGLVLRPDLDGRVTCVGDIAALGLRLANREPGSEARSVLDRAAVHDGVAVHELAGSSSEVHGHLQVAAAIASGLADAGVASEPAALAYGLAFVPLSTERFDLAVPPVHADAPEVRALTTVLGSPWLRNQLAMLPGYDATTCGAPATSP
ncbi:MAG: substrate-binding domain-containing protein [Acidimicrobiales bacterium]